MVHIVVEMCTQYARLRIVLPMIRMKLRPYVKEVLFPIVKVLLSAPIIPIIVYLHIEHSVQSFFLICTLCVICSSASIYWLGCTVSERQFVKNKMNVLCKKWKR